MCRIHYFRVDGLLTLKKLLPFKDSNLKAWWLLYIVIIKLKIQFVWSVSIVAAMTSGNALRRRHEN